MFEKYGINDLFLAVIDVMYPEKYAWDENVGSILRIGTAGYGYLTILKKEGSKYVDLDNRFRKISTKRDPIKTSYTIGYIKPLSEYYTQDGKKKETFSRRRALIKAEKYYDQFQQDYLKRAQERQKVKVLQ